MPTASHTQPAEVLRQSKRITNRFRIAAVLEAAGELCVETGDGTITRFATARIEEGTLTLLSPPSHSRSAQLVTLGLESKGMRLSGYTRVLKATESELFSSSCRRTNAGEIFSPAILARYLGSRMNPVAMIGLMIEPGSASV